MLYYILDDTCTQYLLFLIELSLRQDAKQEPAEARVNALDWPVKISLSIRGAEQTSVIDPEQVASHRLAMASNLIGKGT